MSAVVQRLLRPPSSGTRQTLRGVHVKWVLGRRRVLYGEDRHRGQCLPLSDASHLGGCHREGPGQLHGRRMGNPSECAAPILVLGLSKRYYTPIGIRESGTFSVNIPSAEMLLKTDYCGLVSGRKTDKSGVLEVFFGGLKTAPMILDCPLCMECKVLDVYELPTNDLFIGEIVTAYAEERYLTDGQPDIRKMNPMVLSKPDDNYWAIGEHVGKAYAAGRAVQTEMKSRD